MHAVSRAGIVWAALLAAGVACAAAPRAFAADEPPGPRSGHLLIVGGGLKSDNAAVYRRLFDLLPEQGTVCIVPAASATPREAAAGAMRDLNRYGPEGLKVEVAELTRDDPIRADDAGAAAQIRSAGAIWFTGGDQSRIARIFRPGGRETASLAAAREVLAAGGIIAGSSAGAAMMSDPMITGGSSRDWLALMGEAGHENAGSRENGDEGEIEPAERLRIGRGLGFFPYGIVDQHFLARGRLGRLILALEASGVRLGYGVADDRAMHADLSTARIEAIGIAAVVVVDVGEMKRDDGWRNIRLSLLGDGDAADGLSGVVTPAAHRVRVAHEPVGEVEALALEPWSRDGVLIFVRRLAQHPGEPVVARDDRVELRLTADDRTMFLVNPEDPDDLCAIGIRLDLIVR